MNNKCNGIIIRHMIKCITYIFICSLFQCEYYFHWVVIKIPHVCDWIDDFVATKCSPVWHMQWNSLTFQHFARFFFCCCGIFVWAKHFASLSADPFATFFQIRDVFKNNNHHYYNESCKIECIPRAHGNDSIRFCFPNGIYLMLGIHNVLWFFFSFTWLQIVFMQLYYYYLLLSFALSPHRSTRFIASFINKLYEYMQYYVYYYDFYRWPDR